MKLVAKSNDERKRSLDIRDQKLKDLMTEISIEAAIIGSTAHLLNDLTDNVGVGKMDHDHIRTCIDLLQRQGINLAKLENEMDIIERSTDPVFL